MKVYKLTDHKDQTFHGTQWGINIKHKVKGVLIECDNGFHAYPDPLLAVLFNPMHGKFELDTAHLWQCAASKEHIDDSGLKTCHRWIKTIKQIPIPAVTDTSRMAFGILCAKEVCPNTKWNKWADNWLNGKDRSEAAMTVVETTLSIEVSLKTACTEKTAIKIMLAKIEPWETMAATRSIWAVKGEKRTSRITWAALAVEAAVMTKPLDLVTIAQEAMEIK